MGAPDLLQHLQATGLTLSVEGTRLIVKPRERLTEANRETIRAHRDELIRLLTDPIPRPIRAREGEFSGALTREPVGLVSPDARPAWTDADIAAYTSRVLALTRRSFSVEQAEAIAEQLVQRDQDGDDRRMCVECSYLSTTGRCHAAASRRLPSAHWRLEPVQTLLQRCEAFGLKKGLR